MVFTFDGFIKSNMVSSIGVREYSTTPSDHANKMT